MLAVKHFRVLLVLAILVSVFSFTSKASAFENIKFDAELLTLNGHFDFSVGGEEAYPLDTVAPNCRDIGYGIKSYSVSKGTYPIITKSISGGSIWSDWSFFSDVNLEIQQQGDGDYWTSFQIGYESTGRDRCRSPLSVGTLYSTAYRLDGVWSVGMLPNCFDGIQNQDETDIDTGGICEYKDDIYSSMNADVQDITNSSFTKFVQTLGTNLEGILTRIDIQSSKNPATTYASRPVINIYECGDDNYGDNSIFNGSGCTLFYSATSNHKSQIKQSTQSFFIEPPIFFDPQKYYFFTTNGNNIFNTLPFYYGSSEDTVDGSCYKFRIAGGSIITEPCPNISDLFFNFHGVRKSTPPPCTENCFSNVLFLPGLEASRLYDKRPDGSEDQLWEPNGNSDVEDLYLNPDGTSVNTGVYTRDIIKETNLPAPFLGQNIYKSFSNMMDDLVSDEKIHSWQSYAYDWRYSVDDIVNNGTDYETDTLSLIETLQTLVDSSKSDKVTIVAHSNGGLLAKALLQKLQDDKTAGVNDLIDKVDVLIMVAVPEIGTASAVPALVHGYKQSLLKGLLMDEAHARELGRNMPGAFGLLPSREYINRVSASPVTFSDTAIPSGIMTQLIQTFGSALDSYAEYKNFLFGGEGRVNPGFNQTKLPISLSQDLFTEAESLHDGLDAWLPPENLRVIEVAGWGLDTVASFEYYPKYVCESPAIGCEFVLDQRPRFTRDGDKTVVVPSAHYMGFLGDAEKYWVDIKEYNRQLFLGARRNRDHADILEIDSLNDLIKSVVNETDIVFDSVLRDAQPIDESGRLQLSIHSPVTLDAYDAEGNHTGKVCPTGSDFCFIEEGILNSSYWEFGEGKYLNLPEDQLSRVELRGTDVGTFTYISEQVAPDGSSEVSSFTDVPVTSQTTAEIRLNADTDLLEIQIDTDGDGEVDETILPDGTELSLEELIVLLRESVQELDIKDKLKKNILKKIDKLEKKIAKKIKQNTKILGKISKKISKQEMKGKIDSASAEEIVELLHILEMEASVVLDGDILTELREKIEALDIKKNVKKSLLKRVDNLEKKKALIKTLSSFSKNINKKNSKGKIADEDAQIILDLLQQIEDVI